MASLRKVEIKIGACAECPYCMSRFRNLKFTERCYYTEDSREIPDSDTIPDWCPLEKVEKC